jgi:Tfp pilus assembly protein PilW
MVRGPKEGAGTTLIEAMVMLAAVAILAFAGAQLTIQVNRYFMFSTTRIDIQREARAVMYVITREIRQATANSIVINRANANQPPYSQITFDKGSTAMTFQQNCAKLEQVTGGKTQVLTKNLRFLAFTFSRSDDLTIVSVSFTLSKPIYQGQTKNLHMVSQKVQVMN